MAAAPELPPPGEQSAADRRQISQRMLILARQELASGSRLQAGEKAWGAVVQPMKAIAEQRGWRHQSHNAVRDVMRQISLEYRLDPYQHEALVDAYRMGHENFYENQRTQEELSDLIDRVEEIVPVLNALTTEPPRPLEITSNTQLRRLQRLTGNEDLQIGAVSAVGFSLKHTPPSQPAPASAHNHPNRP